MTQAQSRYPHFDVMDQADAWDSHTQSVIARRCEAPHKYQLLSSNEVSTLRAIVGHLLNEDRSDLLDYVAAHFDQRLTSQVGEAQRKQDIPPEAELVRHGLAGFDAMANHRHGKPFVDCDVQQQFGLVAGLQHGHWETEQLADIALLPQKELFKKLLSLATEAFASHPSIWSEMGYAGPAYPRGYYRIELGVVDPWEPKANGSTDLKGDKDD